MNTRMWAFLVGLLFIAAVKAEYCLIVLSDTGDVYNVTDHTLTAYLPINPDDILETDISGNDLPNMPIYFNTSQVQIGPACRDECSKRAGCQFYAYDICEDALQGACWLKSSMSAPRPHTCRAYGILATSIPHDIGGGNYTMNLCQATSCGRFGSCQICQNVGDPPSQYCTANDAGAVYSQLSYPFNSNPAGYDMSVYGDSFLCPDSKPRESIVHVVCNQPTNRFVYINEPTTCTYVYEAYLTGNCTFVPPVPALQFTRQTKTSVQVTIVPDTHLFGLDYPLSIRYNVWMEGALVHDRQASTSFFVTNLPDQPTYTFTVQGIYNGRASAISQGLSLTQVQVTQPEEQVIENMISAVGQQVDYASQRLQSQITDISSRIDVDVVQVLRHTDNSAVDIREKLYLINNSTLVTIQNSVVDAQNKVGDVQRTVNGFTDKFYDLQKRFDAQQAALDNQTNYLVNNIKGGSSGGVTGVGIFVGIIIGAILGVVGALFAPKLFAKAVSTNASGGGYRRTNALINAGDDEEN